MKKPHDDLSILDLVVLFLPAVPGTLFFYMLDQVLWLYDALGLELKISVYVLMDAIIMACGILLLMGFPFYCWYFFGRRLGDQPVYPVLLYLPQCILLMLAAVEIVRTVLFPSLRGDELSDFLLLILVALGLLALLMLGISAGVFQVVCRRTHKAEE